MRDFISFLNEIRKSDLEQADILSKADQGRKKDFSNYPFNHIFGNRLRIVIPLSDKDTVLIDEEQIKEALKQQGWNVDFNQGIAWKQIQTHRGPQERKMRLGRLLKKLSQKNDFWQEALHWWELKADKTKKMGEASGVSIIISRSPIDIIRMSDFSEWQSCHAPPNKPGHTRFYSHAIQEAKTGGAIAYVVHNQDLKKIKNLQAEEIFADPDRNIEGICPLERLRLRRFTVYNYNGYDKLDILIPELKSYGIRHLGFVETVWEWAKRVQSPYIDFNNPPDWDTADLRGGNYQDTAASKLWSKFFGVSAQGEKHSIDQDTYEVSPENVAQLIQQHRFNNINVYSQSHYENILLIADINFVFPLNLFLKDPPRDIYDDDELSNFLHELLQLDVLLTADDIYDYYETRKNSFLEYNNWVYQYRIIYSVNPETDSLEEVEHFLDDMEIINSVYKQLWKQFYEKMIQLGYIKNIKDINNSFNNFYINFNQTLKATSKIKWIGTMDGIPISAVTPVSRTAQAIQIKWRNPNVQKSILNFLPKHYLIKTTYVEFSIDEYPDNQDTFDNRTNLFFQIKFTPNNQFQSDFIDFIQKLDKKWDDFHKQIFQWWKTTRQQLIQSQPSSSNKSTPSTGPRFSPPRPENKKENNNEITDFREWLARKIFN